MRREKQKKLPKNNQQKQINDSGVSKTTRRTRIILLVYLLKDRKELVANNKRHRYEVSTFNRRPNFVTVGLWCKAKQSQLPHT